MATLEQLLESCYEIDDDGLDPRLQAVAEQSQQFYQQEYFFLNPAHLQNLERNLVQRFGKKTPPKILKKLALLSKTPIYQEEEFFQFLEKQLGEQWSAQCGDLLRTYAYHQGEILDILEVFEGRLLYESSWAVLCTPEELDSGNQKYQKWGVPSSSFYQDPINKEKGKRFFLNGYLEYLLWEYQLPSASLVDQLRFSLSTHSSKNQSQGFIEAKDQEFSLESAIGYLQYRGQNPETRSQSPRTVISKLQENKYLKIFTLPIVHKYYTLEAGTKKTPSLDSQNFPLVGKFHAILHPKSKEVHHANISNTISWVELLFQKQSNSKNNGDQQMRNPKNFIQEIEELKQAASQDSTTPSREIEALIAKVGGGLKLVELKPEEKRRLNQCALQSPKVLLMLKQAQFQGKLARKRKPELALVQESEGVLEVSPKEAVGSSFAQQWWEKTQNFLKQIKFQFTLPALATVGVALFLFLWIPQAPQNSSSKRIASQLTERVDFEWVKHSFNSEGRHFLGFSTSHSLKKASLKIGVLLTDLELAILAKEDKNTKLLMQQLQKLVSQWEGTETVVLELGQISASSSAELSKKIEEFLKKKDLAYELQLGSWLEGARLASIGKIDSFFQGPLLQNLIAESQGKIPPGAQKQLQRAQTILKQKNKKAEDYQKLEKIFHQLLQLLAS